MLLLRSSRNLGATAATWEGHGFTSSSTVAGTGSLFYQFGRPVPLAGALGALTTESSVQTFAYTIKNPMTYIGTGSYWSTQDGSTSYMWYDKNVEANSDGKSIFDPSPIGWRMPINGTWSAFNRNSDESQSSFTTNETTSGRTYTASSAYYPYSSRRNSTNGTLAYIGSNGYCWSSSPSSAANGSGLNFGSSGVYPSSSLDRANGFPARSVRE